MELDIPASTAEVPLTFKFDRFHMQSLHYNDVTMDAIASQITSLTIVYSTVYSDADQRNHQSSAPLAFVRGIHRWPVNSPHQWPVTRKMFPFDDVIMWIDALIVLTRITTRQATARMYAEDNMTAYLIGYSQSILWIKMVVWLFSVRVFPPGDYFIYTCA